MKPSPLQQFLFEAFTKIPVVDAHEHLPPEPERVAAKVDIFTLFSHYTRTDIITAGMPAEVYDKKFLNPQIPLTERWQLFKPYLEQIRFGSYARPAFIAVKEFYGFDDVNDDNYQEISQRMQAQNTPGIYYRILREKCNIRVALTQSGSTAHDLELLIPLMPLDYYANPRAADEIKKKAEDLNVQVNNLDDYVNLMQIGVARWKAEGAVGIKMVSTDHGPGERQDAESLFNRILSGKENPDSLPILNPLRTFLTHQMLDIAAEQELTVAVHSGVWGDFRTSAPTHMIPIVIAHPETRFDLYHAGVPYVRETGLMGKNFPNIWLNLCWCHIISPKMTCLTLDEWIDLVPINKIIGFGGDYRLPVEKVYGHLLMARQNIAKVLSGRVEEGLMTEEQALQIAQKWFYQNPKELYRLKI